MKKLCDTLGFAKLFDTGIRNKYYEVWKNFRKMIVNIINKKIY